MIKAAINRYLDCYRRHPSFLVSVLVLTGVFTVVNAGSIVSDYASAGTPIDWRRPALYELTSALAIIALVPLIVGVGTRWPPTAKTWLRQMPVYIAGSMVFSALHITLMVLLRIAATPALVGGHYDFFSRGLRAIPYEYWKDARTFLMLFAGYMLIERARKGGDGAPGQTIELKSGATRILIDPAELLYAKSAANYADVVTQGGTSLARVTLAELEGKLQAAGVAAVRIHRSTLVNKAMIQTIDPVAGGDLKLTLKDGTSLRASRRYKAALD